MKIVYSTSIWDPALLFQKWLKIEHVINLVIVQYMHILSGTVYRGYLNLKLNSELLKLIKKKVISTSTSRSLRIAKV